MSAYLLLPILQAVFSFGLAAVVAVNRNRQPQVSGLYLLVLGSLGIWGFLIYLMRSSPDTASALLWERLLMPVILLVAASFYHFSLRYTANRKRHWLIPLLYSLTVLSLPLAFTDLFVRDMQLLSYGYAPVMGPLMPASLVLVQVLSFLALMNFYRYRRNSPDPIERSRILYIMAGIIILDVGGLFDILPVFNLPLYPGFVIGSIVFAGLTTVSILKYNLFNIHFVLRRSAVYALTAAALLLISFISFLLISGDNIFSRWYHVVILVAEIMALPIIWTFFDRLVNRLYYRDRYSYIEALKLLGQKAYSVTEEALGEQIVRLLARALHVPRAYLLLPDSNGQNLVMGFSTNGAHAGAVMFDIQSPLMKTLAARGRPTSRYELELLPQFMGRERAVINLLETDLAVPGLMSTGQFASLILLGPKKDRKPYSEEEKKIVQSFLTQITVKLENIRLYAEANKMRLQLQQLSYRLVQAQEEERREIARELHDEIAQSLIMTKMLVDGVLKTPRGDPRLAEAQSTLNEVIAQVREMSLNLRPGVLDDLGLYPAVEWLIDRFSQRTGIHVDFRYNVTDHVRDGNLKTAVYRIIQESLNNIAKHAQTAEAGVSVARKNGSLHIEISDSGRGFDPSGISRKSIGLASMRERIGILGGTLRIESAPGTGTWIIADIPLTEEGQTVGERLS